MIRTLVFALAIAIVSAAAKVRAEPGGALQTIDESVAAAELISASADGSLVFQDDGRKFTVLQDQLIRWNDPHEPQRGPIVVSAGGSRILAADPSVVGDVLELQEGQLRIDHDSLGELRLPWQFVRAIFLSLPADLQQRDRLLQRTQPPNATTDLMLLANGDELQGTLLSLAGDTATLRSDIGEISFPFSQLLAILPRPPLRNLRLAESTVLIGLEDGSLLSARRFSLQEGQLQADLSEGIRLAATVSPIYLQSLSGKFSYLSDLKPAAYRHVPFLSTSWPLQSDQNVLGGQLRSAGRFYPKGLGMHSAAQVTYVLGDQFSRFEAEVALDETAGGRGSVVFRVYLLAGNTWQAAYASDVIRGTDSPVPVSVSLKAAKAITLMIDFADRGDELDHANWLNARLIAK